MTALNHLAADLAADAAGDLGRRVDLDALVARWESTR